jgi:MFS family permease
VLPAGLAAALSGTYLTLFSPLPPTDDALLGVVRVLVGIGMAAALVVAVVAIRRRDVPRHRAWMTRAYALGAGAGTQAVLMLPWTVAVGAPSGLGKTAAMTVAWVLNLVVAEIALRRTPALRTRPASPSGPRRPRART